MKSISLFLLLLLPILAYSQDPRPAYCEELPVSYDKALARASPSLPKFATAPTKEYKIQVAILRYTDPTLYPFHPLLVARYRPCEEVWVVESRESYPDKKDAQNLRNKLVNLGYQGAYLVEMMGYR